ncbi:MAG: preprotein translocase subunit SecA [Candidatus Paceibacterota bacterium]|jgi:preprotein translocase subunit SecA
MAFLAKLFGNKGLSSAKVYEPLVLRINALEAEFGQLADGGLKAKTQDLKARLTTGAKLDDLLPEAFALVREAAKRTLGERHFDVQLLGGAALHFGKISEMRTGEGKTLVATLPAYLNALTGCGVHVVTVNDYLSRRDAVWMGQIYNALGLSVGVINHESSFVYDPAHKELDETRDGLGSFKVVHEFLRPVSRKEAYATDITYGTNHEFGFDYLRDNIEYDGNSIRQRQFHYAIVDEIDSILIDEARTPLIISAPTAESDDFYTRFAGIAEKLHQDSDYEVDEKLKAITLKDAGIEKAQKFLGIENIYTEGGIKYVHHLETAVRAKAIFKRDADYVVKDDEVIIVDPFTGRLQPGRRWSEGLHQAIEAKEGVKIQKESRTFASITFQNYFRMYEKLSGMTGTAATSSEEFFKVYGLDVVIVPTNREIARVDNNDQIFQTETGKFKAVAKKIKELNKTGQPVLVGTVSVEKNELLSAYLKSEGVPHQILNAKNHEQEGEIIAQAGRQGAVTIATNMAGRGVDIKLGGSPLVKSDYEAVKGLGGLFVLGTERHEARRIDNQLRGRSGRQGDPGATQFFVSLDDSLMRVFASDTIKKMMGRFNIAEDEPIENRLITKSLESAQTKIEGFNFDARKHVLEYDDVLNLQRKTIYERRRKVLLGEISDVEEVLKNFIELEGSDETIKQALAEKEKILGKEVFLGIVKRLILQTVDMFWVEHLEVMDYLRGSVNLRAYGQRDPLVEYKKEGLRMFKDMEASIRHQVLELLPKLQTDGFKQEAPARLQEVHDEAKLIVGNTDNPKAAPAQEGPKVGRNDLCPCGSGKKFKRCHGQ